MVEWKMNRSWPPRSHQSIIVSLSLLQADLERPATGKVDGDPELESNPEATQKNRGQWNANIINIHKS